MNRLRSAPLLPCGSVGRLPSREFLHQFRKTGLRIQVLIGNMIHIGFGASINSLVI
ncbi:hypothetical protein G8C92_10270 [Paenibacillus donghaensis]|uniref:hypothetical protein n=1 Tax=Paenibacillus donghaensis TaxID=414771 RepID=UPI0018832651|nr:hypothetical protein [Paenibacillus donghaensis]MBE9914416.1 hypothetical protein [Paenibacillus donghaensis]